MGPDRGLTRGQTGRLTVGRKITLTFLVAGNSLTLSQGQRELCIRLYRALALVKSDM
jgi:hypothetical protein